MGDEFHGTDGEGEQSHEGEEREEAFHRER
jgi:hypothetical protein